MEKLKITSFDDIQKVRKEFKEGEIVELPEFENGKPFNAQLKRLSLLELCKSDIIPNQLLGSLQELFEGRQKSDIKKYSEILDVICGQVLVAPLYEEVKDILSDLQKMAIFAYSQHGVAGLLPFLQISKFQKTDSGITK